MSQADQRWRLLEGALGALVLLAPASADTLVTEDGRILECKKAREAEGGYTLTFEHGEILVPSHLVAEVAIEGDMSDYVPKNDDEREKLAQGYVRYEGKWTSKAAYEAALKRKNEERQKRMQERALHTDFANAWEKETDHFLFRTNTSPDLLEHYSNLLEAYYRLMDKRVGIKPSPTLRRTKMTVNIYKSHQEFLDLSSADSPSVLGYFWSYDQTLNFFHDYQEPARSDWVALHECTHLLTYLIDPQFNPSAKTIWINEGVADFFGSAEIEREKGGFEIVPGMLQTDRVLTVQQAIKDGKDTRLEDLLKLSRDEFDGFQYAHAWSFVYFLNESSPKYEKAFKAFFKDLYSLTGVEKATVPGGDKSGVSFVVEPDEVRRLLLKKLGHKDTIALEKEWKDFIAAIPIEAPEARFKRAYRMIRQGVGSDIDQAIADLDFAIENGYRDARAYWARGLLKSYLKGKFDEGTADLRLALELDPLNPAYRFDLAQLLCGRIFGVKIGSMEVRFEGEQTLRGSAEELAESKVQFGLAKELDPENDLYIQSYDEYLELYRKHGTAQK